jgi:hypothetical protein
LERLLGSKAVRLVNLVAYFRFYVLKVRASGVDGVNHLAYGDTSCTGNGRNRIAAVASDDQRIKVGTDYAARHGITALASPRPATCGHVSSNRDLSDVSESQRAAPESRYRRVLHRLRIAVGNEALAGSTADQVPVAGLAARSGPPMPDLTRLAGKDRGAGGVVR